jgi:hypothetical protein
MMNHPLDGQILYNSSLSNAFMLKLRHIVKPQLLEMMAATGMDIAEHEMRSPKVIPASLVMVSYTHSSSIYLDFGVIRCKWKSGGRGGKSERD